MNKFKRKLYEIKDLKRSGFSYIEIGQKVRRFKGGSLTSASSVYRKFSLLRYIINLIKKLYVKSFKKFAWK